MNTLINNLFCHTLLVRLRGKFKKKEQQSLSFYFTFESEIMTVQTKRKLCPHKFDEKTFW